jgi:hypothetical protein
MVKARAPANTVNRTTAPFDARRFEFGAAMAVMKETNLRPSQTQSAGGASTWTLGNEVA